MLFLRVLRQLFIQREWPINILHSDDEEMVNMDRFFPQISWRPI